MTITPSDERLREILDGCEGVTPGPWITDDPWIVSTKEGVRYLASTSGLDTTTLQSDIDAAHIARLDPQTVASIVRELLSLRHSSEEEARYVLMDRSLVEAACSELREWKVDKGGDDQVVLNLEARLER